MPFHPITYPSLEAAEADVYLNVSSDTQVDGLDVFGFLATGEVLFANYIFDENDGTTWCVPDVALWEVSDAY